MIDRRGQVWEDEDGMLVYLVLETHAFPHRADMWHHKVMFLVASTRGYKEGELATEFENLDMPWEQSTRRRLA